LGDLGGDLHSYEFNVDVVYLAFQTSNFKELSDAEEEITLI
jgi:hypothetical protein